MMQAYVNWMSSTSTGYLLTGGLGDWAAYDKKPYVTFWST
jgi:hypothetical protein